MNQAKKNRIEHLQHVYKRESNKNFAGINCWGIRTFYSRAWQKNHGASNDLLFLIMFFQHVYSHTLRWQLIHLSTDNDLEFFWIFRWENRRWFHKINQVNSRLNSTILVLLDRLTLISRSAIYSDNRFHCRIYPRSVFLSILSAVWTWHSWKKRDREEQLSRKRIICQPYVCSGVHINYTVQRHRKSCTRSPPSLTNFNTQPNFQLVC